METQEVHVGRSVQRRRDIPGSCHNGAGLANSRCSSHLRHGRFVAATDLAVQPAVRQADRRLATSTYPLRARSNSPGPTAVIYHDEFVSRLVRARHKHILYLHAEFARYKRVSLYLSFYFFGNNTITISDGMPYGIGKE